MKRVVAIVIVVLAAGVGTWRLLSTRSGASLGTSSAPATPAGQAGGATAAKGEPRQRPAPPRFNPAAPGDDAPETAHATEAGRVDGAVPAVHRPLIAAIRTRQATPADKRAAMLKALSDSGSSKEQWTRAAPEVFGSWRAAMNDLGDKLSVKAPACYQAGCAVEVRFADIATYQQAAARIRSLAEPAVRHGGRVLTPPEHLPSGEITANWIMMSPAGDGRAGSGG